MLISPPKLQVNLTISNDHGVEEYN
jgi:hypothetical protein